VIADRLERLVEEMVDKGVRFEDAVREFEAQFHGWLERKAPQVLAEIRDKKEIPDGLCERLAQAVNEAKAEFVAAKGIKAA